MEMTLVDPILERHGLSGTTIRELRGSFGKQIFLVDDTLLVRASRTDLTVERTKFGRIAALDRVPRVRYAGTLDREGPCSYLVLDQIPGRDLEHEVQGLSREASEQIGREAGAFLDELHNIPGPAYDIGPYIPLVPGFKGSWEAGHRLLWDQLAEQLAPLPLDPSTKQTLAAGRDRLEDTGDSLAFEHGPRLLHNDFHPKNLIVTRGHLSGVIDWECSQYGEPDYDLVHLIHWLLDPPEVRDYHPFVQGVLGVFGPSRRVPRLEERLTIYQIEHELCQLVWSQGRDEVRRSARIHRWLQGEIGGILRALPPNGWQTA